MAVMRIQGKQPLAGTVRVSGMKNAITPILSACVLMKGVSILRNVPRISDVESMIDILSAMGAHIMWVEDHALSIDTSNLSPDVLDVHMVKKMRSSVLLLGPLVARFGRVALPEPGGCIIGNRPMGAHVRGLTALGARVVLDRGVCMIDGARLQAGTVVLPEFSVTATENVLMAASVLPGMTTIHTAAVEPHVLDLVRALRSAGARIETPQSHVFVVHGNPELHAIDHTIIPDQIEAGTFAVLGALTGKGIRIEGVCVDDLLLPLQILEDMGVSIVRGDDFLEVDRATSLVAHKVQALPYPGFPTDLQSIFGVLATQAQGTTLIHDPLYEGRMGYIHELVKMGAQAVVADPHRVLITGPTPLYGTTIRSLDLRAGASLIIAALIAEGETEIYGAEVVYRGYECIDERLRMIGAHIVCET